MGRNTHGQSDLEHELISRFSDLHSGYIVAGGIHDISGTTSATIATCAGYVRSAGPPSELLYVEETTSKSVTYGAGNGVYWTIIHADLTEAVGSWTRVTGSHYLTQLSATQPSIPDKSILLMQVTVTAGAIVSILDFRRRVITSNSIDTFSYTTGDQSHWTVLPGGMINPASGVTVSHAGTITAGEYQIFDVSDGGLIGFPNGAIVQAAWWGARVGTNSAAAIEYALNANPSKMDVRLGIGTYIIEAQIDCPSSTTNLDWALRGAGQRKTILQRATGFTGTMLQMGVGDATNRFTIEGLQLDGIDSAVGTVGLRMYRAGHSHVREVLVKHCEHAMWVSGGSYQNFENCLIENCGSGLTMDNTDAFALTFARVTDCIIRHCDTVVDIDTVNASGIIRNIGFYGTSFENDQMETGIDRGLRIRGAEQIHLHECWFESCSMFVDADGNANQPMRWVTFSGCNFGTQNDDATTDAFQFQGSGLEDGEGSFLEACRIGAGNYFFDATYKVAVRNTILLSTATIEGPGWYIERSDDNDLRFFTTDETDESWKIDRLVKDDLTTIFTRQKQMFTKRTTGATVTTIGSVASIADNTTVIVTARVMARKTDDTEYAMYHRTCLATVDGAGAVTIRNTADEITAYESTGTMDFSFSTGTNTVLLRGTGVAASNIDWYAMVWAQAIRNS